MRAQISHDDIEKGSRHSKCLAELVVPHAAVELMEPRRLLRSTLLEGGRRAGDTKQQPGECHANAQRDIPTIHGQPVTAAISSWESFWVCGGLQGFAGFFIFQKGNSMESPLVWAINPAM
jgi:hypothetical protein